MRDWKIETTFHHNNAYNDQGDVCHIQMTIEIKAICEDQKYYIGFTKTDSIKAPFINQENVLEKLISKCVENVYKQIQQYNNTL